MWLNSLRTIAIIVMPIIDIKNFVEASSRILFAITTADRI